MADRYEWAHRYANDMARVLMDRCASATLPYVRALGELTSLINDIDIVTEAYDPQGAFEVVITIKVDADGESDIHFRGDSQYMVPDARGAKRTRHAVMIDTKPRENVEMTDELIAGKTLSLRRHIDRWRSSDLFEIGMMFQRCVDKNGITHYRHQGSSTPICEPLDYSFLRRGSCAEERATSQELRKHKFELEFIEGSIETPVECEKCQGDLEDHVDRRAEFVKLEKMGAYRHLDRICVYTQTEETEPWV